MGGTVRGVPEGGSAPSPLFGGRFAKGTYWGMVGGALPLDLGRARLLEHEQVDLKEEEEEEEAVNAEEGVEEGVEEEEP